MSDQCGHCALRGKIAECLEIECGHHENWINKVLIKRLVVKDITIGDLGDENYRLRGRVDELVVACDSFHAQLEKYKEKEENGG